MSYTPRHKATHTERIQLPRPIATAAMVVAAGAAAAALTGTLERANNDTNISVPAIVGETLISLGGLGIGGSALLDVRDCPSDPKNEQL